ncbi:hypothetical protein K4F52_010267, partial [Lecanicillium sp. MT-2017a]
MSKRRAGVGHDGRAGKKICSDDSLSLREQAREYQLAVASMPLDALTSPSSPETHRRIDPKHVRRLCEIFNEGRLEATDERHYILVKASAEDVERMMRAFPRTARRDAHEVLDFSDWLAVNKGRHVEVVNGLRRAAAARKTERRRWICVLFNAKTLPKNLELKLRHNRRDEAMMEDSPGDMWMQIVAAASFNEELLSGAGTKKLGVIIKDTLQLHSELPYRFATLWGNERWRNQTTRLCRTSVGREVFNASRWDCMISLRIDNFWFRVFDHVCHILAGLPGNAAQDVGLDDWKQLAAALPPGARTRGGVRELFYPGLAGESITTSSPRRPDFLADYDDDLYWST